MPTLAEFEEWVEQQIPPNLHDLPIKIHDTLAAYYDALYTELTRYGSPLPDLGLPSLREIEEALPSFPSASTSTSSVPLLPPAPPPPKGTVERIHNFASRHPIYATLAVGTVVAVGVGCIYPAAFQSATTWIPGWEGRRQSARFGSLDTRKRSGKRTAATFRNGVRKEAVVVLGADTPIGRALALHLSSSAVNLIVIGTVSSPSAAASFETLVPPSSRGYVKALVLDVRDSVSSLSVFMRALQTALSLRWPLTSAGDPYARTSEMISVVGVVNALSFLPPDLSPSPSTEGRVGQDSRSMTQLSPTTLSEALEAHVVAPLCALSSLASTLRGHVRGNQLDETPAAPLNIISIVSEPASSVALPLAGKEAVVAHASSAGLEALRRECDDAAHAPDTRERAVRVSTVGISAGPAFGAAVIAPQESNESLSRPSPSRVVSSSGTSLWRSRDAHTVEVLNKITDLLFTTSRLSSTKQIHLWGSGPTSSVGSTQSTPSSSSATLRDTDRGFVGRLLSFVSPSRIIEWYYSFLTSASHRAVRLLPDSALDVLLAIQHSRQRSRRNVQARAAAAAAAGASLGPGPGPASSTHRRSTIQGREQAYGQTRAQKAQRDVQGYRLNDLARTSDSERGASTSSGPASASGSDADVISLPDTHASGSRSGHSSSAQSGGHRRSGGGGGGGSGRGANGAADSMVGSVHSLRSADSSHDEADNMTEGSPYLSSSIASLESVPSSSAPHSRAESSRTGISSSVTGGFESAPLQTPQQQRRPSAISNDEMEGSTPDASLHAPRFLGSGVGGGQRAGAHHDDGEEGPWMGPPSRDHPSPPFGAAGVEGRGTGTEGTGTPALGQSWVELDQGDREEEGPSSG